MKERGESLRKRKKENEVSGGSRRRKVKEGEGGKRRKGQTSGTDF